MIVDIAIGIVLAVIILRYWPVIVAMGAIAATGFVIVAIAAAIGYAIATNEALLQKASTLAVLLAAFGIGSFVSCLIAKRTVLTASEVGVLMTTAFFLINATGFFYWFIANWARQANDPILFFYLLPLLALWAWLLQRLTSLQKSRKPQASE